MPSVFICGLSASENPFNGILTGLLTHGSGEFGKYYSLPALNDPCFKKRKAAMQLKRRETYRLRKNSRSHAFLVDPTTAVSERITSASCNSDFPQQTALTIRELPTLPEKASSYQICTNEPQDNLTRGEQICSSLSIYEIGCTSGMSTPHVATLMPTKGHTRIKKSVLLL
ncbi:uncharacterized protein LOC124895670 [Capsicum annuum]|uniref:uncharacterized protein LOC124895640 n=1 Tax=Capsicum annuum TaxID=4072 RepID=UPI001FB176AE|nr:uncharacterized protein LOC124895640 [Capsicum annuum]XP_047262063.1 uncharacterized protein LOC124895670 [Capsicum annuum]